MAGFGGMGASFAYRLPILAFVWLVPLTPDLEWPALMLLGTFVPLMTIPLARSIHRSTLEGPQPRHGASEAAPSAGWSALGAGGMLLVSVLFFAGVFGVRPYVVTGISMEPAIGPGDLAIVDEKISPESLQVNDILRFHQGGLDIVHRVVSIEENPGGLVFTTRGDNVTRVDPPIGPDQIEGKVVFVIPELGRPVLWLQGAG